MKVQNNIINIQKERKIYFTGILFGLIGGMLTNILVTSMYNLIDKDYSLSNSITFVVSSLFFLVALFLILKQIKKDSVT